MLSGRAEDDGKDGKETYFSQKNSPFNIGDHANIFTPDIPYFYLIIDISATIH